MKITRTECLTILVALIMLCCLGAASYKIHEAKDYLYKLQEALEAHKQALEQEGGE